MIVRQSLYARINVFFLILINQFQVALGLRFNFFQRDFGNAIQVADEAHRVAFWYQLLYVFVPLATIAILSPASSSSSSPRISCCNGGAG